jgi:hypothetical protein
MSDGVMEAGRTFSLAGLEEDVGHNLVHLSNELEEGVVGEVLKRELALSGVSRVLMISSWRPSSHFKAWCGV